VGESDPEEDQFRRAGQRGGRAIHQHNTFNVVQSPALEQLLLERVGTGSWRGSWREQLGRLEAHAQTLRYPPTCDLFSGKAVPTILNDAMFKQGLDNAFGIQTDTSYLCNRASIVDEEMANQQIRLELWVQSGVIERQFNPGPKNPKPVAIDMFSW